MARQAHSRIRCRFALRLMQIVASRARHARRRLKTPALLQQGNLVPVNVHARQRIGLQADMRCQRFAWFERKRRRQTSADAPMTLRADIHLPVAFESNRRHFDGLRCRRSAIRNRQRSSRRPSLARVQPHMLTASPMTPLTGNAEHEMLPIEVKSRFRPANLLKISRMAFQTSRIDSTTKICSPVDIARTIHPAIQIRPVRNRQFE